MVAPNRLYNPVYPQHLPPEQLQRYLFEELNRVAQAFDYLRSNLQLDELNSPPARPRLGQIVLADGTNWNPDGTNGAGFYGYDGANWIYFGASGAPVAAEDLDDLMLMGG
jgi:hypothetical protein